MATLVVCLLLNEPDQKQNPQVTVIYKNFNRDINKEIRRRFTVPAGRSAMPQR